MHCRRNFLQVLDGCWFDRKRLDTSEATLEDVQFWLFRVHDDVTRRVTFERAAQRLTQANLLDQVTGFMTQTSWPDHQQCNECVTPDATLTSSLEYMHVLDARDPANCRGESNAISLWKREEVLAKLAEVYWDPVQWYWRAILPADAAEVEALLQGYNLTVLDLLPRSRFPTTSFVWIGLGIVIVILFATCCCLAALRLNRGEWISKDRRAAGMRHLSQSDVGFEDEVDEGGLLEVVTSIHKFCNRRKRSRSGDSSIKDLDELKV